MTGKLENCQVGVFLAYVSPRGQTLYDRRLYLPREWAEDPARRAAATVPADVRFATKPQLAKALVLRALESGLPVSWVTGDEVYGADYRLRVALEEREQPYALTVSAKQAIACGGLAAAAGTGAGSRGTAPSGPAATAVRPLRSRDDVIGRGAPQEDPTQTQLTVRTNMVIG